MPTLKVPTVAAILTRPDGQVFLLQRDDRPGLEFPGWWTLPGGRVEDSETPDAAIRRELWEEIELEVPLSLWQVYERQHHERIGGQTVLIVQHVIPARLTAVPTAWRSTRGRRCAMLRRTRSARCASLMALTNC